VKTCDSSRSKHVEACSVVPRQAIQIPCFARISRAMQGSQCLGLSQRRLVETVKSAVGDSEEASLPPPVGLADQTDQGEC